MKRTKKILLACAVAGSLLSSHSLNAAAFVYHFGDVFSGVLGRELQLRESLCYSHPLH